MNRPLHVTVLVSNDLVFDQRVKKTCDTLIREGFNITLVGRKLKGSKPIDRPYKTVRFRLPFTKGAFFYACLNLRLLFFLLFKKTDVILANDLDTLAPAFLVARLRGLALVYDSHEYFTEAAGLTHRTIPKRTWELIEGFIFPRLRHVYTVNETIANIYREKYHVNVKVVRNIPTESSQPPKLSMADLNLPEDKKIVILQGAYLDIDRGAKEAALAMQYLDDVLLVVIGEGQEMSIVREIAERPGIKGKIAVFGKMPFEQLQQYTMQAALGLSLDKDTHLNYKYSLPNKLFDYLRAGIPVLTSKLPELVRIIEAKKIGTFISSHEPIDLARDIRSALGNPNLPVWKQNATEAGKEFSWENEARTIVQIFGEIKKGG